MMRRSWWLAIVIGLAGCGDSPTRPSSTPTRVTLAGTITDTMSGAAVGSFVQDVNALPAFITVTADGFLTRQTWVPIATPTVDLIREAAPFDLTFYRQLVRGALDGPLQPLRRLSTSPNIYLQTAGLSPATVAELEQAARAVVPALTGGQLVVGSWETGAEARTPKSGWIVVDQLNEPGICGRALVGAAAGHIWLNVSNGACSMQSSFSHELGHALGFSHVDRPGSLMRIPRPIADDFPSTLERHHAAIAYRRPMGNRDLDIDPQVSGFSAPLMVVN